MKKMFATIARSLAALARSVSTMTWRFCRETGRWIAETVQNVGAIGGTAAPMVEAANDNEEAAAVAATAPAAGQVDMRPIRDLAAAIVNGRATAEMCSRVDERTFNWLSTLDRSMVAKVLLASDDQLRGHLRGKSTIKGVVQADEASVNAYREAWLLSMETLAEDARQELRLAQSAI